MFDPNRSGFPAPGPPPHASYSRNNNSYASQQPPQGWSQPPPPPPHDYNDSSYGYRAYEQPLGGAYPGPNPHRHAARYHERGHRRDYRERREVNQGPMYPPPMPATVGQGGLALPDHPSAAVVHYPHEADVSYDPADEAAYEREERRWQRDHEYEWEQAEAARRRDGAWGGYGGVPGVGELETRVLDGRGEALLAESAAGIALDMVPVRGPIAHVEYAEFERRLGDHDALMEQAAAEVAHGPVSKAARGQHGQYGYEHGPQLQFNLMSKSTAHQLERASSLAQRDSLAFRSGALPPHLMQALQQQEQLQIYSAQQEREASQARLTGADKHQRPTWHNLVPATIEAVPVHSPGRRSQPSSPVKRVRRTPKRELAAEQDALVALPPQTPPATRSPLRTRSPQGTQRTALSPGSAGRAARGRGRARDKHVRIITPTKFKHLHHKHVHKVMEKEDKQREIEEAIEELEEDDPTVRGLPRRKKKIISKRRRAREAGWDSRFMFTEEEKRRQAKEEEKRLRRMRQGEMPPVKENRRLVGVSDIDSRDIPSAAALGNDGATMHRPAQADETSIAREVAEVQARQAQQRQGEGQPRPSRPPFSSMPSPSRRRVTQVSSSIEDLVQRLVKQAVSETRMSEGKQRQAAERRAAKLEGLLLEHEATHRRLQDQARRPSYYLREARVEVDSLRQTLVPLLEQTEQCLERMHTEPVARGKDLLTHLSVSAGQRISENADVLADMLLDDLLVETVFVLNEDDRLRHLDEARGDAQLVVESAAEAIIAAEEQAREIRKRWGIGGRGMGARAGENWTVPKSFVDLVIESRGREHPRTDSEDEEACSSDSDCDVRVYATELAEALLPRGSPPVGSDSESDSEPAVMPTALELLHEDLKMVNSVAKRLPMTRRVDETAGAGLTTGVAFVRDSPADYVLPVAPEDVLSRLQRTPLLRPERWNEDEQDEYKEESVASEAEEEFIGFGLDDDDPTGEEALRRLERLRSRVTPQFTASLRKKRDEFYEHANQLRDDRLDEWMVQELVTEGILDDVLEHMATEVAAVLDEFAETLVDAEFETQEP